MSSMTITQVYTTQRTRSLSLRLIAPRLPKLYELPSELIVTILELALLNTKPSILSTISKAIRIYVNYIIYRAVDLDSPKTIRAFHRTATTSTSVLVHVKKLAVTWCPEDSANPLRREVKDIIAACIFMRVLVVPSFHNALPDLSQHHELTDLTIQSFDGFKTGKLDRGLTCLSRTVTHLRFTEPNEGWVSPSAMLAQFGSPCNLSHLQLSRRTNSNEANDLIFANDINDMLQSYKSLRILVVSIFNGTPWLTDTSVEDSNIWNILAEIRNRDDRVFLVEGEGKEWGKEWKDIYTNGNITNDFWLEATKEKDALAV